MGKNNGNGYIEEDPGIRALRVALSFGREIAEDNPEIAEMYREGFSHSKIADYLLDEAGLRVGITSRTVLENAVQYALRGNPEGANRTAYSGLLDIDEYRMLSQRNRKNWGKSVSDFCRKNGTGIFGLTEKQVAERNAKSAISQGRTIWEEAHKQDALLWKKEGYSHKEIAEKLNEKYHNGKKIRDRGKVDNFMTRELRGKRPKRTYVEWTEGERLIAEGCRESGMFYSDIAKRLNEEVHDGEEVRNKSGVWRELKGSKKA